ncbi:unnamed protein product [Coregonus sp. 'balchen']|nr:unnamed protein product [Coregonus sp. 'balchen']
MDLPFSVEMPRKPDPMTFSALYNHTGPPSFARPVNTLLTPISVAGVMTAPWCISGRGGNHLGELECNCTMYYNGSNTLKLTVNNADTGEPGNRSSSWNLLVVWKMAYYSIPSNWGGTCTVGFVVTAMRTIPNNERDLKALFKDKRLPGTRRDKRSLADITHTQAHASRFFFDEFLIQKTMGPRQFQWSSVALLCICTGVLMRTVGCPLVGNLTEGGRSPERKGPTPARSSGPEVDGHHRRSPERKVPTQVRSRGPEVNGHRQKRALLGPHNNEDNLFLSRAKMVANFTFGQKECWVCGLGPVKVGAGLPLVGFPIGVNLTI